MSALLLATLLAATTDVSPTLAPEVAVESGAESAVATFASPHDAAAKLELEVQTGTLIFSRGDCLAVKIFAGGPYTHVAAVVVAEGKATVYDSMNGVGVRKESLEDYLASQNPDVIHMVHPVNPMTADQSKAFVRHLEHELGRPYAVKHHLTGVRAKGIHCSEYVTDSLIACNLLHANQPSRVSPASLAEGIIGDGLYAPALTFAFAEQTEEVEQGSNWCQQLWIDTKVCTSNCCVKMRRMFCCR